MIERIYMGFFAFPKLCNTTETVQQVKINPENPDLYALNNVEK